MCSKKSAYITPIIGVIRIGGMKLNAGKKIPYMTDSFRLTETFKRLGEWEPHNLQEKLIGDLPSRANGVLRSIPVRVLYKDPDLNTMERYESYSEETKRLQCAGNGEIAQRLDKSGSTQNVTCAGPANCDFAHKNQCQMLSRTIFKVDGQEDSMSGFLFRSSGYNAQTTIRTRLEQYTAKYGDLVRHLSFNLVLKAKSSAISEDFVFYFPDLVLSGDEGELLAIAKYRFEQEKKLSVNIDALEEKMKKLASVNHFNIYDDNLDDVEEFIPNKAKNEQIKSLSTTNIDVVINTSNNDESKAFKLFFNDPSAFDNMPREMNRIASIASSPSEIEPTDLLDESISNFAQEKDLANSTTQSVQDVGLTSSDLTAVSENKDTKNVLNLVINQKKSAIEKATILPTKRKEKGFRLPELIN